MRTGDVMHAELACANEPGRREGAPRGHAAVLLCTEGLPGGATAQKDAKDASQKDAKDPWHPSVLPGV